MMMTMTPPPPPTASPQSKAYFGIDYSMSSPAIAEYVWEPRDFNWTKVQFHFLTKEKKFAGKWLLDDKVESDWCSGYQSPPDFPNNEARFEFISQWAMVRIRGPHWEIPRHIAIEDYAMGARGRVFEIAENTGALKQAIRKTKYDFKLYPPTVVKKFATGKGNSDKDKMYEAWMKETDYDIWKMLTPGRGKISSPVTDIVDAYFILKKLVEEDGNGH
jgi:hypothetical protein